MSAFRVLQFPAEDSYNGEYLCRIPVVDAETYHGEYTPFVPPTQFESIEEVISHLEYYGVGSNLMSLFTDLRMNNEPVGTPPGYNPNFLLHQVYPDIQNAYYPDAETTVTNTVKVFNSTVGLPIKATHTQNTTQFIVHSTSDSNILRHQIDLTWDSEGLCYFHIVLGGVYTDQLNGNKFDFSGENQDCPIIDIGVSQSGTGSDKVWFVQGWINGGAFPIGLNIKTALDGNETDDAEQDSDDPYDDGGDSGGGGGGGSFDDDSDDIDFPPLPDISATDTGFISLYVPSAAQLNDLAN